MKKIIRCIITMVSLWPIGTHAAAAVDEDYRIYTDGDQVHIVAGKLTRTIHIRGRDVDTISLAVAGDNILSYASGLKSATTVRIGSN